MLKKIKLNYDFDVFLEADYSTHSGSCISHQVHELTDIHESYGGFPNSYSKGNTEIKQLWYDATQVDYKELGTQLNMEVVTVSSILQPPGNTVPIHRDTFFQIKKRYPNDVRQKVRANIYLEDWKVGHFLTYEIDKEWHNSTHWIAGDGFLWDSDHLHLSTNAGMKDKYTLQVSGFLKR